MKQTKLKFFKSVLRLFLPVGILFFVANPQAAEVKEISWVGCGVSKLGFMQDLATAYRKKTGVKINLEGGGATKGIRQVAENKSHLGGSCRLPLVTRTTGGTVYVAPDESNIKLIPVGWDALVVVVHPSNTSLDSITLQQLRDVLTGKISNWKQLGTSLEKPINLYVRKGKISGVGITLRQQLFNNVNQEFSPNATVLASSGKVEKALEADPFGIAVSGISSSRHRNLRMLKLDNVEPTMENLKEARYNLYRILFLVAPTNYEKRPELKSFVDFALSLDGQKVITKAGTLPYHRGISLLQTAASPDYLDNIEAIDRKGIYTLGGH